jgi:hypothetical protein
MVTRILAIDSSEALRELYRELLATKVMPYSCFVIVY